MSRLIARTDVTYALGFTPYDAANPVGYQTAGQVTTSLSGYATTVAVTAAIAPYQLRAERGTPGGYAGLDNAGALVAPLGGTAQPVTVRSVLIDGHRLRAYGCKLDGVTDDGPALQAAINDAATYTAAALSRPSILIDLPAGAALGIKDGVSSGACNTMIRGAGPNLSVIVLLANGAGTALWTHGTLAVPSPGYLHIKDVTFLDANPAGSGKGGLACVFNDQVAVKGLTIEGVAFRKFTAPVRITDAPRGQHISNVTVFGPDNTYQVGRAGFECASTGALALGSFGGFWQDVMVANYEWGWRYSIAAALEGETFTTCNAYNGWGGWQVNVTAANSYLSLLWSFNDCDWQGLGFGLDLSRCRLVTVRGGFWIVNLNPGAIAPPNGAPRRRALSFKGCQTVRCNSIQIAHQPGQTDLVGLVHCDSTCYDVLFRDISIISFSQCYAGFEIETNTLPNVVREQNTKWQTWQGSAGASNSGPKVLDAGGNQAMETVALAAQPTVGSALGALNANGRYDINGFGNFTTDSAGRVAVSFPTRVGGGPFFLGGPPVVVATAMNNNVNFQALSLVSVTTTGFVVGFASAGAGLLVSVNYSAAGI